MDDAEFERWYRNFLKYVIKPHNALALLRDTGATDARAHGRYRRYWRRFACRHPLRAWRLPIPRAGSGVSG